MTMYKRDMTDLEHAEVRSPGTVQQIQLQAATIAASMLHKSAGGVYEMSSDAENVAAAVDAVAKFATRVAVAIHRELRAIVSPRGEPVSP